MAADMHTHSEQSPDSICPIDDLCRAQIERGIQAFALTDHCDIEYCHTQDVEAAVRASVASALSARERYRGKTEVLCGVEIGDSLWDMEFAKGLLCRFPFDVVIGSVHAVRYPNYSMPYSHIDFSEMSKAFLEDFLTLYFEELLLTLENFPCDVMAHLTCPLRYINGKYHKGIKIDAWRGKIDEILEYIIAHNIALEVNTSGLGTPWDTLMPQKELIARYRSMGGYLITLGSDAHKANRAAFGFEEAEALLRAMGFEATFLYRNRRPEAILL